MVSFLEFMHAGNARHQSSCVYSQDEINHIQVPIQIEVHACCKAKLFHYELPHIQMYSQYTIVTSLVSRPYLFLEADLVNN